MYPHRVIEGKVYREVSLEASDTREAAQHISAERPMSCAERRAYRERLETDT